MRMETTKHAFGKLYCGRRSADKRGTRKKSIGLGILVLSFYCITGAVQAQEYPTQPITMLIDRTPGAGTDILSRAMAIGASKVLGQEIIPVNKPGAGGAVAAGILATSRPDGYTILALTTSSLAIIPHMEPVSYDPLKDIIPIVHFGTFHTAIIVRADSPHKSFKELIDFARKNPGKASFGVIGIGNSPHLDMELVMMQEKVDIAIIPFGGAAPTVTALLGGHITSAGVGSSAWMPNYKAGKIRLLAIVSEKRIIPDVPNLHEFGYPYYGISTEYYLMGAPKGTPEAIVKKLEWAFRKAMDTPVFRTAAENLFVYDPNPLPNQPLRELIERLYVKNGEIIKKAKLGK